MKRAFIIHGWGGNPGEAGLSWLNKKLTDLHYQVLAPQMPDTDNPKIGAWVGKLREVVGKPTKNDFFIGHSIGCQTILRYLESIKSQVGGAVFVAGWFDLKNMESDEEATIAGPWISTPITAGKIKKVLPRSTLIISDNDPYAAFEYNKQKFQEISSKIIVLKNAGHITEEDGFTELPEALVEITRMK